MRSVVKNDHKAVIAFSQKQRGAPVNVSTRVKYRRVTPNQHARFLQQVSADELINPELTEQVQEEFDHFYKVALEWLDRFYPEKNITVRSPDPDYVTPYIKA